MRIGEGRYDTEAFDKAEKTVENLISLAKPLPSQIQDNIRGSWQDFATNAKKWCDQKSITTDPSVPDKVSNFLLLI